jgi:hypothetical protein
MGGWLSGAALLDGCDNLLAELSLQAGKEGFFYLFGVGPKRYGSSVFSIRLNEMSFVGGAILNVVDLFRPVTVGQFFEHSCATARFATMISDDNYSCGKGKIKSLGAGGFATILLSKIGSGWPVLEGVFRIGILHNCWENENLHGYRSENASGTAFYQSAQMAIAYGSNLRESYFADFHCRYFLTHLTSAGTELSTEEKITFQPLTLHRLRIGGRIRRAIASAHSLTPWCEGFFEKELFAAARNYEKEIDCSYRSLKGSCAAFGLGLAFRPSLPISCDIALRGSVGAQRYLSASANIIYEF